MQVCRQIRSEIGDDLPFSENVFTAYCMSDIRVNLWRRFDPANIKAIKTVRFCTSIFQWDNEDNSFWIGRLESSSCDGLWPHNGFSFSVLSWLPGLKEYQLDITVDGKTSQQRRRIASALQSIAQACERDNPGATVVMMVNGRRLSKGGEWERELAEP